MIHKACPVVLHPDGAPLRHVQYRHPETGLQLVTTTIPQGDTPMRAAAQHLFKTTGLETSAAIPLGQSDDIANAERWHFTLCRIKPPVRDEWVHVITWTHSSRTGGFMRHSVKCQRSALAMSSDWPRGMAALVSSPVVLNRCCAAARIGVSPWGIVVVTSCSPVSGWRYCTWRSGAPSGCSTTGQALWIMPRFS